MEAKTDWTNNSSEMKRKRNRASYEDDRQSGLNNFIFSGGDALLGNTRPHPEHDG